MRKRGKRVYRVTMHETLMTTTDLPSCEAVEDVLLAFAEGMGVAVVVEDITAEAES